MNGLRKLLVLIMLTIASVPLKATDGCSAASSWFSGVNQFWCSSSGDWENWQNPRGVWIALMASPSPNWCADWRNQLDDMCSMNGMGIVIELWCDDTYGYYEGECCTEMGYCPY